MPPENIPPSTSVEINPQEIPSPQIPPESLPQNTNPSLPPSKTFLTKKLLMGFVILIIVLVLVGGSVFAYQKLGNNGLLQSSNCTLTLDEKTFPNRILDAKILIGVQKGGTKANPDALASAGYFGNPITPNSAENGMILTINNESEIFKGLTKSDKKYRSQELTLKAIKNQISNKEKEELIDLLGLKNKPEILEIKKIGGLPVYMTQDKPSNSGTVIYEDTKTKLIITMITIRTSHNVEEYFTEWQKQVCQKLPPTPNNESSASENQDNNSKLIDKNTQFDNVQKANIETYNKALEIYKVDNKSYPASLDKLVSAGDLSKVIKDPNNAAYLYSVSSDHNKFAIYAVLLNGELWCQSSSKGLITAKSPSECTP